MQYRNEKLKNIAELLGTKVIDETNADLLKSILADEGLSRCFGIAIHSCDRINCLLWEECEKHNRFVQCLCWTLARCGNLDKNHVTQDVIVRFPELKLCIKGCNGKFAKCWMGIQSPNWIEGWFSYFWQCSIILINNYAWLTRQKWENLPALHLTGTFDVWYVKGL